MSHSKGKGPFNPLRTQYCNTVCIKPKMATLDIQIHKIGQNKLQAIFYLSPFFKWHLTVKI